MSSEADADQVLMVPHLRGRAARARQSFSAHIASDSAGWCSYGSTGVCRGASTPRT